MCSPLHSLLNTDNDISNVLPQQPHADIPVQGKWNVQSDYLVTKTIDNAKYSIVKRKANNVIRISMKNKLPQRTDQRSLVLVFDATESMSRQKQKLREGAEVIFNKLSGLQENPIYNFIFVPFREENGTRG